MDFYAMRRFYSQCLRLFRRIQRPPFSPSRTESGLIGRLPVVGARFEDNGWVLEVRRVEEGVDVVLCGTYGERVAGGLLSANQVESLGISAMFPIHCGDVILEPAEEERLFEIRTLGGQLIGHVPRLKLMDNLRAAI